MTIYRNDSTPDGKRIWDAVERAARNAPEWAIHRPDIDRTLDLNVAYKVFGLGEWTHESEWIGAPDPDDRQYRNYWCRKCDGDKTPPCTRSPKPTKIEVHYNYVLPNYSTKWTDCESVLNKLCNEYSVEIYNTERDWDTPTPSAIYWGIKLHNAQGNLVACCTTESMLESICRAAVSAYSNGKHSQT